MLIVKYEINEKGQQNLCLELSIYRLLRSLLVGIHTRACCRLNLLVGVPTDDFDMENQNHE